MIKEDNFHYIGGMVNLIAHAIGSLRSAYPASMPLAMRSPISLSMLRQYSNARCSTGGDTPFLR